MGGRERVTNLMGGWKGISSVLGILNQRYLVRHAGRSVQRFGYKNLKPNREVRARDTDFGVINSW